MCGEKYEKEVRVGGEEETSLEFKVDLLEVSSMDWTRTSCDFLIWNLVATRQRNGKESGRAF